MIPRTAAKCQTENWQDDARDLVRDPAELIELLALPAETLPAARAAAEQFALRVPRSYVARMAPGDLNDPLLRQVLPLGDELIDHPGYTHDPLGEQAANALPGLIHKYHGRVLLIVSGSCVINCRYCFRRHFPYADNRPGRDQWGAALDYIAADPSITEVIFSGGDPLSAADAQLAWLAAAIEAIPHVRRLRVHSRLPVVMPSRVTDALLDWLGKSRLCASLVIHANHPNELDDTVAIALARLRAANITLLNQTVLLRGINDDLETLSRLSESLFALGVLPYYLHLLDPVAGAAHFDTERSHALTLHQQLRERLPGYLVPKLVQEIAGEASKTPVA
ncbi:EF-P beta-lysylation protein EpmB [Marinimicrobium alkaliphilum]|uniref:EF-P beta-lysylation protein EpmB n=1 Tax=Marinimicrobium alkaliphilum TaxID=2202654 RepID=UPI000DB9FAB1|nr:EF-P beta-lysylation protein EpmB [Marinimicrobium alkaliphilum]